MRSELLADMMQIPRLNKSHAIHVVTKCKICGDAASKFDIVDFYKYCSSDYYAFGFSGIPVIYYKCQSCSFVFTDFCDDWTQEDFTKLIYNSDYPLIDGAYAAIRPTKIASEMASFLADHRSARILDYGSGTGVFAERMKASGFTAVENYDPFASPKRPSGEFDIITCFETIEHSPFPRDTIADLHSFMKPAGCIIFSTGIQPANINELRANWWYIGPRNGHVSIFTMAALELLGARAGLEFYSGHGKLAFAGRNPSPQSMPLLHAIGPMRVSTRLTALADPPAGMDWHPIEGSGPLRFRWTRTGRVEWTLENQPGNYPCRLALTIPFVMEIIPGYAERCLLQIGGRDYPVHVEAGAITVEVELDEPIRQPIALIMPEPQRPSDLRDTADRRTLGLAIPLAIEFV